MSKNWDHLITDRTKLIILNSPHNPTGGTLSKRDIKSITEVIGDRNIMVLSDEIYSRLMFDGAHHHSIMSEPGFKERTILLDGFSKTYAMTGWRMGYGVMRPDLATQMARLATNSTSCTASFTQIAGIEALRGYQAPVDKMRTRISEAARCVCSRVEPNQGLLLPSAQGRVLCFSQYQKNRMEVEETGRRVARRGGRGMFWREPRSAITGRVICASASPIRWRI